MQYRPDIDGLRALAVVPVLFFHAGFPSFAGGFLGVDIFFVISGFLITNILVGDLQKQKFSIRVFYERRARRILPALFVVLATTLLLAFYLEPPESFRFVAISVVAAIFFVSNLVFWKNSNYFNADTELNPVIHTWSLGIEEQFYLVYPIALWILWRYAKSHLILCFSLVALISLLGAELASRNAPGANFYFIVTRAWELLVGAITAQLCVNRPQWLSVLGSTTRTFLCLLALLAIVTSIALFDEATRHPSSITIIPVVSTAMLLAFGSDNNWVSKLLGLKPLVAIGLISYSLYLWHQPLFAFARNSATFELTPWVFVALMLVAVVLSVLTYFWVEKPFRNRKTMKASTVWSASGLGTTVLVSLCLVVIWNQGFKERLPPHALEFVEQLQDLEKEWYKTVLAGQCHYDPSFSTDLTLSDFLEQWDCFDKNVPLIIGDSHAADVARSLRTAGIIPGQLTLAGCAVVPSFMKPNCKQAMETLRTRLAQYPEKPSLVLVNQWNHAEARPQALKDMLSYWSPVAKNIVVLTSMPEFHGLKKGCLWQESEEALWNCLKELEYNRQAVSRIDQTFYDSELSANVTVVNTKDLLCSITPDGYCGPAYQQRSLYMDPDHLSPFGANQFGAKLARLPMFAH